MLYSKRYLHGKWVTPGVRGHENDSNSPEGHRVHWEGHRADGTWASRQIRLQCWVALGLCCSLEQLEHNCNGRRALTQPDPLRRINNPGPGFSTSQGRKT